MPMPSLLALAALAAVIAFAAATTHVSTCYHAKTGILRQVHASCCPGGWHEFVAECNCPSTTTATPDLCAGVTCEDDDCNVAGTCNPSTGMCSEPTPKADGTTCDDGDASTGADKCAMGTCSGVTGMYDAECFAFLSQLSSSYGRR